MKKYFTEKDLETAPIEKILIIITKDVMELLHDVRNIMKRLEALETEVYEKPNFVSVGTVTSSKSNCAD